MVLNIGPRMRPPAPPAPPAAARARALSARSRPLAAGGKSDSWAVLVQLYTPPVDTVPGVGYN